MSRTTMATLITRCRRYVGDVSSPEHFTDDEVQDAIDEYRYTVRYAMLRPGPTLEPGALYNWTDYYADRENWEDDLQLTWNDFSVLTPATSDNLTGHWTFNLAAPGQYPVVRITGKYYDLHAAAADLLEQWANALAPTMYNFSSDGQSFSRFQVIQSMRDAAERHRQQAFAVTTPGHRDDLMPAHPPLSILLGGPGDVDGN